MLDDRAGDISYALVYETRFVGVEEREIVALEVDRIMRSPAESVTVGEILWSFLMAPRVELELTEIDKRDVL